MGGLHQALLRPQSKASARKRAVGSPLKKVGHDVSRGDSDDIIPVSSEEPEGGRATLSEPCTCRFKILTCEAHAKERTAEGVTLLCALLGLGLERDRGASQRAHVEVNVIAVEEAY